MHRSLLAVAAIFFGTLLAQPVFASDKIDAVSAINHWYALHAPATDDMARKEGVGALLLDDAVVRLVDLDIEQTRDEYLGSLDSWTDAIDGGAVAHKIIEADETSVTASVCYRFSGNEMLAEEQISLMNAKIKELTLRQFADTCDNF